MVTRPRSWHWCCRGCRYPLRLGWGCGFVHGRRPPQLTPWSSVARRGSRLFLFWGIVFICC